MKIVASFLLLFYGYKCCSQTIWSNPSYKKNTLIIYSGSGASTRHVERNYFHGQYNYYLKSPFLSLGGDYCFSESPSAYWGIGIYCSNLMGVKKYKEKTEFSEKFWSSSLIALKLTHHSKFFVTKKFDLSSCYIIGLRAKNYYQIQNDSKELINKKNHSVLFAGGVCLMAKYYINKNIALYAEGALGLRVDLLQIGLARKLNLQKFKGHS